MKVQIYNDVYNISKRIKDIDKNYYIVFNTSKHKFEVHNSNQNGSSYCLTIPYDELDERSLNYVLKTQSVNIDEILNEIENDNNLREGAKKSSAFSQIAELINDVEK